MEKLYLYICILLAGWSIVGVKIMGNEKIIALESCSMNNPIFKNLQLCYECEFAPITKTSMTYAAEYDQTEIASHWSKDYQIYLFYIKSIPAGFCVINMQSMIDEKLIDVRDIAEFYIVPLYRKSGFGKKFAQEILKQHKGLWEIRQLKVQEYTARQFWRKVILSMDHSEFKEMYGEFKELIDQPNWTGFVQRFRLH